MGAPPAVSAITLLTLGVQGPPGPSIANYPDWKIVTAPGVTGPAGSSQAPYTATPDLPGILYDGTGIAGAPGPGTITLWAPLPGDIAVIRDFKLLSASGSVITVNASGGWTIENPSNPGVFAGSAWIADPTGAAVHWKASGTLQAWVLW